MPLRRGAVVGGRIDALGDGAHAREAGVGADDGDQVRAVERHQRTHVGVDAAGGSLGRGALGLDGGAAASGMGPRGGAENLLERAARSVGVCPWVCSVKMRAPASPTSSARASSSMRRTLAERSMSTSALAPKTLTSPVLALELTEQLGQLAAPACSGMQQAHDVAIVDRARAGAVELGRGDLPARARRRRS